ncbi:acyltransferase family protein [Clostridium pasteurianum]|uniref:Protein involved in polysaccharide intercellular adhesin (PIA) synthesis/biofilm formation n=1 Tax=Clostridium pasteurianum BC1 TaxID=86416 RepID=R4JYJ3_CLOPA|nr:acyltransferase [Clostridium pasteurianum]AGK95897.1 protein involved in polysaccharide intercellular adhesin (PIA) synthesis/biofilm formation [Clostridium pasteurianum BC1]
MQISLKHMAILYFCVGIILPFLIVKDSNIFKKNTYNSNYLSKDNTNILKGLSVVIIIIHHLSLFLVNDGIFKTIFSRMGFLAVSIFLFVSGYGLMVQFTRKKERYFKGYFKNKILRLYLIFFCANIISTLLSNIFLNNQYTIIDIIKSSLLMNFADGRVLWFVAVILYFYIIFYIAFKLFNKNTAILLMSVSLGIWIALNIFLHHGAWYYNSAICFPLGIIVAEYNEQIFKVAKKYYLLVLSANVVLFLLGMTFYIKGIDKLQFIIPIFFVILILSLLMKVNLKSQFFYFMNGISFEFYLFQLIALNIVFQTKNEISSLFFLLAFLITVILSKILNVFVSFIFSIKIKRNLISSKP